VSLGSGNSSKPSTHESANVVSHEEQEKEVGGTRNSTATDMEQMQDSVEATVEENVVVLEAEGITDFTEYIKYDPGLRIQIEEFSPNVREDVRFSYLKNGPTQPMIRLKRIYNF
jgi:hypothetical protein